jgi:hypothetical protein
MPLMSSSREVLELKTYSTVSTGTWGSILVFLYGPYRHRIAVLEPACLGPGLVEDSGQLERASGQPLLLLP